MNKDLHNIKTLISESASLTEAEKETLLASIKAVDKEIVIIEFKLQRTEKVKRTTSVLLEETIDELEKKRSDVVQANEALKKSLDELKAAQVQLIHSEKMASLGELTAGIAHEIQNPLNFVNNFSEVGSEIVDELHEEITSGNLEEVKLIIDELKLNLEKITTHGKRASGIVKGMLEHSRSSDGEKQPTDINVLADEYLRLSYHGLRAKDNSFNVSFKTEFDESLPKINIVPQDIGRVLLNLINNAFFAVDKKAKENSTNYKPEVVVRTSSYVTPLGGQNGAVITVSDNGPGIPHDIKNKIFQPFFTTKPTGSGTGLGLSLSYDIVNAHGGELTLTTAEGEGSEFRIRFKT